MPRRGWENTWIPRIPRPGAAKGVWAFVVAGDPDVEVEEKVLRERFRVREQDTRYYTPPLRRAAFVLPRFAEEPLAPLKEGR